MKVILVPLSLGAMKRLDYDENILGDLSELFLTEEDVVFLLNSNLIKKANDILNIIIDEYEDEKIINLNDLDMFRLMCFQYIQSHKLFMEIYNLVNLAIEKRLGYSFIFSF